MNAFILPAMGLIISLLFFSKGAFDIKKKNYEVWYAIKQREQSISLPPSLSLSLYIYIYIYIYIYSEVHVV